MATELQRYIDAIQAAFRQGGTHTGVVLQARDIPDGLSRRAMQFAMFYAPLIQAYGTQRGAVNTCLLPQDRIHATINRDLIESFTATLIKVLAKLRSPRHRIGAGTLRRTHLLSAIIATSLAGKTDSNSEQMRSDAKELILYVDAMWRLDELLRSFRAVEV